MALSGNHEWISPVDLTDSDAILNRIRELIIWKEGLTAPSRGRRYTASVQSMKEYTDELTGLVKALDRLLSNKGFPPSDWLK